MLRNLSKNNMHKILSITFSIVIVDLMLTLSAYSSAKSVVFSGIAAIAIGALISPKRSWNTNKLRMIASVAICSFIGLLIAVIAPGPFWLQVILVYAVAQAVYLYSGTNFTPMMLAAVSPVVLGVTSILYPLSAVGFTALIAGCQWILEKFRTQLPYIAKPYPNEEEKKQGIVRAGVVLLACILASVFHSTFFVAAPLLVAFTDLCNLKSATRKHPVFSVLLFFICAGLGILSRLLFSTVLGLPIVIGGCIAFAVTLLIMDYFMFYLPSAGVLSLSAFLIPFKAVPFFPFQILAGAVFFMFFAKILFREEKRYTVTKQDISEALEEEKNSKQMSA